MYALRKWSVRHARLMERAYAALESSLLALAPLLERIGHRRLERPVAAVERVVKGALFDCRMCGQCALSSTGMSCPMNCPKTIRNGPCGGVRPDGHCEVKPEMRCVWVEGWEGARRMRDGDAIHTVQFAVDHRLRGSSSWLRVVREKTAGEPLSEKALGNVVTVRPLNASPDGAIRGSSTVAADTATPDTDVRRVVDDATVAVSRGVAPSGVPGPSAAPSGAALSNTAPSGSAVSNAAPRGAALANAASSGSAVASPSPSGGAHPAASAGADPKGDRSARGQRSGSASR